MHEVLRRLESIDNVLTHFEPDEYIRFEPVAPAYDWDTARGFLAYKADGWYDYYAVGPDGTWWRSGANMPAIMGWDIEALAQRAGV